MKIMEIKNIIKRRYKLHFLTNKEIRKAKQEVFDNLAKGRTITEYVEQENTSTKYLFHINLKVYNHYLKYSKTIQSEIKNSLVVNRSKISVETHN